MSTKISPFKYSFFALAAVFLASICTGCGTVRYLAVSGYEQAKLLLSREDLTKANEDPRLTETQRMLLAQVPQVRAFAQNQLALNVGGAYSQYVPISSEGLSWIVMAARRDRFELKTWWFPIVGVVPYKGFLTEADARSYAQELEASGEFETSVRPAAAFSTLGWFDDPVVTTMLDDGPVSLTNTLIHELFHRTAWVPNYVDFNESSAHAVGTYGAALYYQQHPQIVAALQDGSLSACEDLARQKLIASALEELYGTLNQLYQSAPLNVLEERQKVFTRWRERLLASGHSPLSATLEKRWKVLNNATLMQSRLYYTRLSELLAVLSQVGVPAFIAKVKDIDGDPWMWLDTYRLVEPSVVSREPHHEESVCRPTH